jgi:hypothetical protein
MNPTGLVRSTNAGERPIQRNIGIAQGNGSKAATNRTAHFQL